MEEERTVSDEKFQRMTKEPVEKLIRTLAVPTIISMLITSVYNMADTFFVSRISTSASGAVGIAFSLMAIIQAIGFTFGAGSGNYISRLLGQKDRAYAAKVAATGFCTAFGLGVLLSVLGLTNLDRLVYALGATNTIAPYAKDYIRYILIGIPFMITSFVLNQVLRYQGSAYYAMIGIGIGGLLNIILDPIFIFHLNMGTGGAALATIISQFVSFVILLRNSGIEGNISIEFRNFTPSWIIYKEILRGGLPSFYRQALASVAMIFLNFSSGVYGDAAVAAMSIVARVSQFSVSIIMGFGQGFQPVCGYNYGAKRYDRVLRAFWYSVRTVVIGLTAVSALAFILSPQIIALFRKEDLDVILIGTRALRFRTLALPLSAFIITTNMLVQTIGKGTMSTLLSISRQGLFFLPAITYLPRHFGLLGVQMSQPIADLLSFFVALFIAISVLRELQTEHEQNQSPYLAKSAAPKEGV
jgi:putative MATE family efflux protein